MYEYTCLVYKKRKLSIIEIFTQLTELQYLIKKLSNFLKMLYLCTTALNNVNQNYIFMNISRKQLPILSLKTLKTYRAIKLVKLS